MPYAHRPVKHGLSHHPLYSRWAYYRAEKKGRVYPAWDDPKSGLITFIDWAEKNGWENPDSNGSKVTLVFKDRRGAFCPENCHFVRDYKEARNRVNNIMVEFEGKQQRFIEVWSIHRNPGIPYSLAAQRVMAGWDPLRALNERRSTKFHPRRKTHSRVISGYHHEE